ncbi:MAG: DUF1972 domain-containing protein [Candidatus Schekmanbacteria bacterium]|nr:DUF1972 domain-containing protein [Candidatus Schekmanbacteria bacterium]
MSDITTTPQVAILGTRGIPAAHGGFETFAERLALHCVARGWSVCVYCQIEDGRGVREDIWNGVRRVQIPVSIPGAIGTVVFDWKATRHAARTATLALTLGYNTAAFTALYRLRRIPNVINMDGLEWKRDKWAWPQKIWLWFNERLGCWFGNHLIADNPHIADHLATRVSRTKITMIPYGADAVDGGDTAVLSRFGVEPHGYALVVARPEPENSILEVVRAFVRRPRRERLVVLGDVRPEAGEYQRAVREAATQAICFPGAIYDRSIVETLRYYAGVYVHGHRVGGTNPSLVEALAASSPVLAHDNPFNRWVAGAAARYFSDEPSCARALDDVLGDGALRAWMRVESRRRYEEAFRWERILAQYEELLHQWHERASRPGSR